MSNRNSRISRRDFLKIAGAAAGAAAVGPDLIGHSALPVPTVLRARAATGSPIVLGVGTVASDGLATTSLESTTCQYACQFIYRSLVEYDYKNAGYNIVPGIAESWQVLDEGLRYRFKLREDVVLHDGTKFNAEVMANYVKMETDEAHPLYECGHQRENHRLGAHKAVEVVDEYTIDFVLSRVNPAQMDWFTQNAYAPMSQAALDAEACDIIQRPASTGPYKYSQWDPGQRAVLEKHEEYFDPEVGLAPQLIFRAIPEPAAQVAALEAGEVHWIEAVSPEEAERLRGVDGIVVVPRKTLYVWFLSLDTRKEPLNNVKVRQALNYAIDKDAIVNGVLAGAGERSYAPLSPQFGDFYAGDDVLHYDYNPELARQLLSEAGYANGFDTTIHTTSDLRPGQERSVEICEIIQAYWADIGVNANIEAQEWSTFEAQRINGDFAIASRGWTPWTGDPDGTILQNFHPDWHPPNGRGVCFLDDEEATRLMDEARSLFDLEARVQAWKAVQKRIVELAPWVFVHHAVVFEAHTDKLKGYKPWAGGIAAGMDYAYLEE